MTENPLITRLRDLRAGGDAISLYAVVDGIAWEDEHGQHLERAAYIRALFDRTPDAGLAHAGPWVVDTQTAPADVLAQLVAIESRRPSLIWVYSCHDLDGLAVILRSRLDARLPDGRMVLLRFYDPRALLVLHQTLTQAQRAELLTGIDEVHVLNDDGHRIRLQGYPWGARAC